MAPKPRIYLAAGLLTALIVGCGAGGFGCGKTTKEPQANPSEATGRARARKGYGDDAVHGSAAGGGEGGQIARPTDPQVLAVRNDAQRKLLGRGALFDDSPTPDLTASGNAEQTPPVDDGLLDALPGSSGIGDEEKKTRRKTANGNALGLFVPIEDPSGTALTNFYNALNDLETGKGPDDFKVRVLAYGASHTQADIYPAYMRHYLQQRFGNGGRGYVSLAKINRWHRQPNITIENSKGWLVEHAQRWKGERTNAFGLLGARATCSRTRDYARIKIKDATDSSDFSTRFEYSFLKRPGGGRLELVLDDKVVKTVNTRSKTPEAGFFSASLPGGAQSIEARPAGGGEVTIFGVTMENDQRGVVVDTLGISGTRAANMLKWDEEMWAANVTRREPTLITLAYGTNEATDRDQPVERYRRNLVEVIARLKRHAPQASCLLIGPGDFPKERDEGVWIERPRVMQLLETQREVAYEMGCGFWDTLAFMGGTGSMEIWSASRPQMASRDHIHFTKRGYVRLGMAVTDALMVKYSSNNATPANRGGAN